MQPGAGQTGLEENVHEGEWHWVVDYQGRPVGVDLAWGENSCCELILNFLNHCRFVVSLYPLNYILTLSQSKGWGRNKQKKT